MPRKSALARLTATVAIRRPQAKLELPADLTPEQAEDWLRIAQQLPEALTPNDVAPLLSELARHMSLSRQLSEELAKLRHSSLRGVRTRAYVRDLLKMHERESMRISALMTKLRLTPQDRELAHQADNRRLRPPASSPKPWELDALELEPIHETPPPPEPKDQTKCN